MIESRTLPHLPVIMGTDQDSKIGAEFSDLLDCHSDVRRDLGSLFNNEPMQQVKVVRLKEDSVLGRHMHPYVEMFTVGSGKALFRLFDPINDTIEHYLIIPGKRLIIPAHIPHDAFIVADTFLVGATQRPYIDPKTNDIHVTLPSFSDIEKALVNKI